MNWFDKVLLIIVVLFVLFMFWTFFNKAHAGEIHGDVNLGIITETKSDYQIDMGIRYDFLLLGLDMSVGGGYLTNIQAVDKQIIRFMPYQEQYDFSFWVMPWSLITIGFRHLCVHPVYSREDQFQKYFIEPKSKTVISVGLRW